MKKLLVSLFLLAALVLCVFSVSPVFDFGKTEPFSGPDIYNPYASLPDNPQWKRANFHTHTRKGPGNDECARYASQVYSDYMKMGYDVLAFANHNRLTRHPFDTSLQITVYEHGYNIAKFHKLVFGPSRVMRFDHLLPLFPSQKQWQYDLLAADADFIVMNHPDWTRLLGPRSLRKLTGYRFMEADSGAGTDLRAWDEALSAGHYSYCLINDDCHDSGFLGTFARRCSWLNTPSARYEDVKATLLSGCFYSMRVPFFGNGDRQVALAENARLPRIEYIGLQKDTVVMRLSEPALIEAWGQGHRLLGSTRSDRFSRPLEADEPYMHLTAYFDNGVVIYTNAFARYDASVADSPYKLAPHRVNVPLTILFNALLLALAVLICRTLFRLWAHKKAEA